MYCWFSEWSYLKQMIDSLIGKVKFGQTLKAGNKQAGLDGPCVTTYHPDFKKIRQNMEKIEHLLYQDESVKRLFTPLTMSPTAVQEN